jgi:protein-L-isoaspartate(D-aspartate) O-methyltransferase
MSEEWGLDRCLLLDEIEQEARETYYMTGRAAFAPRVLDALRAVPRHAFVPEDLRWAAYKNTPLSIGHRQTISQPYIVALMTDLIDPKPEDVVLEIGCGSGYQAAVLSRLVKQVYSLEIIDELAMKARERLRSMNFDNVEVITGNGYFGLPEHAPYDAIIVTAAPGQVPPALIDQIKPGGTIVVPIGGRDRGQELTVIRKDPTGRVAERSVLPVIFVPLTGSAEIPEAGKTQAVN